MYGMNHLYEDSREFHKGRDTFWIQQLQTGSDSILLFPKTLNTEVLCAGNVQVLHGRMAERDSESESNSSQSHLNNQRTNPHK
ncbi:hypothetical protein D3C81_2029890 [compost metagenome]